MGAHRKLVGGRSGSPVRESRLWFGLQRQRRMEIVEHGAWRRTLRHVEYGSVWVLTMARTQLLRVQGSTCKNIRMGWQRKPKCRFELERKGPVQVEPRVSTPCFAWLPSEKSTSIPAPKVWRKYAYICSLVISIILDISWWSLSRQQRYYAWWR